VDSRLAAYLERLGLAAPPAPDAAGLESLQRAHREAIAFENLDVRLGRPIAIDGDGVFAKLVTNLRGGYCFEQNRLFADMLSLLGIASRPLLARPRLGGAADNHPPRTHVLLLAEVAGQSLIADVGFGGSYVPVLALLDGADVATSDGARHRLRRIGERGTLAGEWLLERAGPHATTDGRALAHEHWQPQYSFDLAEVAPADLEQAHHWTATATGSRFTNLHIATRTLPDGFASLIDLSFRFASAGSTETREIVDLREYDAVLREMFGLALGPAVLAGLPLFSVAGTGDPALQAGAANE
jgi:N-hydroxyarylamine O-acetyltransferase